MPTWLLNSKYFYSILQSKEYCFWKMCLSCLSLSNAPGNLITSHGDMSISVHCEMHCLLSWSMHGIYKWFLVLASHLLSYHFVTDQVQPLNIHFRVVTKFWILCMITQRLLAKSMLRMILQSWRLQVYLLQVLHLFLWNLTLLLTGGPSIYKWHFK